MARSRLLANKILTSEKLNAIDEGSENLFYHLLVLVDDFGRYYAKPKIVRSYCYPLRELSLDVIIKRLDNLESVGLIQRYKNNGETYLEIVEFEKYQKFRSDIKRKEDFPIPTEVCNESDTARNESDTSCNMGKSTVNRNRNENESGNEKEYTPEFESFWKEYPKPKGKRVAFNAWKEHPKKNHKELILAALNYKVLCNYKKTEMDYIKEPSGFIRLAKEYWKDYIEIKIPGQVGESRLPKKTPEKEKESDDYVEARMKKEDELKKKHKYSNIKDADILEKANHIIQNELAKWTKGYYEQNKN
jgi:hypothetical protein